jgi:hypothetical protein
MPRTISYTEELIVEVCWCGTQHAIPATLARGAKAHGTSVYCPLGHQWSFRETDLQRAKADAAAKTAQLDQERARARAAEDKVKKLTVDAARLRKRAAAGVCPCCNRTFQNVGRHMKTQHPDHG